MKDVEVLVDKLGKGRDTVNTPEYTDLSQNANSVKAENLLSGR